MYLINSNFYDMKKNGGHSSSSFNFQSWQSGNPGNPAMLERWLECQECQNAGMNAMLEAGSQECWNAKNAPNPDKI